MGEEMEMTSIISRCIICGQFFDSKRELRDRKDTATTPTKKITAFGEDSLLFPEIIRAISENIGKGTEYNNNLIDDPDATLTKIVTTTKLTYPQLRHYLQLLADQELVIVGVYQKKRARTKKDRKITRPTVTTVKVTHKGYKYLEQEY